MERAASHLPTPRVAALTLVAMFAFAANSILCRLALARNAIDPATFTAVRIASGAAMLALLVMFSGGAGRAGGTWRAALALFAYAAAFSYAYLSLSAGTGALLLFGAVQATMVSVGIFNGQTLTPPQWAGFALALAGLAGLVAPGVTAPDPLGAALMLTAGVAWGVYSLFGRGVTRPLVATAGNFLHAAPMAVALALGAAAVGAKAEPLGLFYAALSGAVTSGLGYAIWYAALPGLTPAQGASVQLSVPVLAALAGSLWLGEIPSARLVAASLAILGGIGLVIAARPRR